ncbi:MAG: hypothetical protein H0X67_18480 [Acidobacteria bacterium]|nr:hypothetical protein [Acidobacteriota bacterium]
MKKLALGCGVVVLLLAIAGAGVAYYVYRQIGATITQFAEFAQVPDLERGVRNRAAFTPPVSGELTEQQVERLVRVQNRIRERLGERFAEFEQRHKTLLEKDRANALDLPEVFAMYRGLATAWMDAKRQQVEALNEVSFSLEEYRWVRDRSYSALGLPFMEIDVTRIIEDMKQGLSSGEPGVLRGSMGEDGNAANSTIVTRFKKHLEENLALATLGL